MTDSSEILERPVLAGIQCIAEYTPAQIPQYRGNPFLEALPPINSMEGVAERLRKFPEYSDEQRLWSKEVRMHCVEQLKHFLQPLPYHVQLENVVSRIIRQGYVARNPISPLFNRQFAFGFKEILEMGLDGDSRNIAGIHPSASGFSIIGLSGIGKSTAIENILLLFPQVIQHTEYHGRPLIRKQLVWLKLECPASGSLRVLCQNFFRQVDLLLGTNYYTKHVNSRSTKENLLGPMAHVASLVGLGMLVIDEIQRLKKVRNSGADEMIEFLTELVNTIGVPVVIIGTYKSLFLFESAFANARRASGEGDHILSNMDNDEPWNYFVEEMWELQWTKHECKLNDDIRCVLYEESQGIPDIAIKLYMNAQWEAILSGSETITPASVKDVAKKCLKLLRPMLKAVRTGDPAKLAKYEDLKPDWLTLDDYLREYQENIIIEGNLTSEHARTIRQREKSGTFVELVSLATSLGMSPDQAEAVAKKVIDASGGMADPTLMRQQLVSMVIRRQELEKDVEQSSHSAGRVTTLQSKGKVKPLISDADQWKGVFGRMKDKIPIRELLLEAELLKPPLDELSLEG